MDLKTVIKKPIITERSTRLADANQYTFQVDRRANKRQIAQAIKQRFSKVKVIGVRTSTTTIKKAIVQLAEGDKIDFLPKKKEIKQ